MSIEPLMLTERDNELLGIARRQDPLGTLAIWSTHARDLVLYAFCKGACVLGVIAPFVELDHRTDWNGDPIEQSVTDWARDATQPPPRLSRRPPPRRPRLRHLARPQRPSHRSPSTPRPRSGLASRHLGGGVDRRGQEVTGSGANDRGSGHEFAKSTACRRRTGRGRGVEFGIHALQIVATASRSGWHPSLSPVLGIARRGVERDRCRARRIPGCVSHGFGVHASPRTYPAAALTLESHFCQ